jgi:AraC-like DNA-binding protein
MHNNDQCASQRKAQAAVLFEYIRNTENATFSIATEHYAIGYIFHGNCRIVSGCKHHDVPECCLYILERGEHIIKNSTDPNGIFEQVVIHLEPENIASTETTDSEDARMEQVVMAAVAENLSLEELAERCYVSVSTFKRRFRRRYSLSPHRWFILRRLDLAYRLTLATDIAVTEIARLCGFTNPSHFISAFKRHYSTTPATLRRTTRSEGKRSNNSVNE